MGELTACHICGGMPFVDGSRQVGHPPVWECGRCLADAERLASPAPLAVEVRDIDMSAVVFWWRRKEGEHG
jgi:hypothetical protein